jgi:hypothetical protein
MTDERKETMIEMLKGAISVCQIAPDREDRGYPYAVGYSLAVMQDVLLMLQESV